MRPMKGRALRRALETKDVVRLAGKEDIPAIQDTTELVTPESAREFLQKNKKNRPINWRKVEEYAEIMKRGEWKLHGQGIMLDTENDILTGQKRLWAVIYANVNVYMRVSRGNPSDIARVIDRGIAQSARDLASRETGRKHSPHEVALARASWALSGMSAPTTDEVATMIEGRNDSFKALLADTRTLKKSREVLMVLAVLSELPEARALVGDISKLAELLKIALLPYTAKQIWGKGAAFGMGMSKAKEIVERLNGPKRRELHESDDLPEHR